MSIIVEDPSPTLRRITAELEMPAISVEYRLAPEHPYPAPLDDCLKVTNFIINNHKDLAVDPNKIIIAGDSSGGKYVSLVARASAVVVLLCNNAYHYKYCCAVLGSVS